MKEVDVRNRPDTIIECPLWTMTIKESIPCIYPFKIRCGLVHLPNDGKLMYFCEYSLYETPFYKKLRKLVKKEVVMKEVKRND